jgi:hypothetical protein
MSRRAEQASGATVSCVAVGDPEREPDEGKKRGGDNHQSKPPSRQVVASFEVVLRTGQRFRPRVLRLGQLAPRSDPPPPSSA